MGTTLVYTPETLEHQTTLKRQIAAFLLDPTVFVEQISYGDENPGDNIKQSFEVRYTKADRIDMVATDED